jgi:predicted enzyme related to lactoylglutathione lyase
MAKKNALRCDLPEESGPSRPGKRCCRAARKLVRPSVDFIGRLEGVVLPVITVTLAVADLLLVGNKGGHTIMTKIKSFTVGLPVTELKRAVEWYRQLLGEVEEVNPAPGVWEFQIVPSGWLQLFESEINEANQSVMRFESHDIEASRMLASSLSINVDQIETVPEAVRYFEFRDPFGNDCRFMSCWRNHAQKGAPADG